MIKVRMRKNDDVDVWEFMNCERGRDQAFWTNCQSGQTNSNPGKEDGICEDCYAKKIEEHCRMPKPGESDLRIAPFPWFWFCESRSDGVPTLNCPFTEQVSEPSPGL